MLVRYPVFAIPYQFQATWMNAATILATHKCYPEGVNTPTEALISELAAQMSDLLAHPRHAGLECLCQIVSFWRPDLLCVCCADYHAALPEGSGP